MRRVEEPDKSSQIGDFEGTVLARFLIAGPLDETAIDQFLKPGSELRFPEGFSPIGFSARTPKERGLTVALNGNAKTTFYFAAAQLEALITGLSIFSGVSIETISNDPTDPENTLYRQASFGNKFLRWKLNIPHEEASELTFGYVAERELPQLGEEK